MKSRWYVIQLLLLFIVVIGGCASPRIIAPQMPVDLGDGGSASITFTRLVIRITPGTEMGHYHTGIFKMERFAHTWGSGITFGSDEFKVFASEELRAYGYRVFGGDNLLFGADESGKAEYQLGGTLKGMRYDTYDSFAGDCTIASLDIEWQLYDVFKKQSVFSTTTTGEGKAKGISVAAVHNAFKASLHNLMAGSDFVVMVKRNPRDEWLSASSAEPQRAISQCESEELVLPGDIETVFNGVVVLRVGGTVGSGVIISEDGFALTAAHVVSGTEAVIVKLYSGIELVASVITVDKPQDIALIQLPGRGYTCIPFDTEQIADIGEEIYAIGAPAGEELAFSVSKGIVSGVRELNGFDYLQTDASLNPGNSGGPLITKSGTLVGIVSWKINAPGFEGLAFGVPQNAILDRLAIDLVRE